MNIYIVYNGNNNTKRFIITKLYIYYTDIIPIFTIYI